MDNGAAGEPLRAKHRVLETGAEMVQDFQPVKQICAFLNAFHIYADDPSRCVEANHYCSHITEGERTRAKGEPRRKFVLGHCYSNDWVLL